MKFRVSLDATEATTAEGQPLVRGEVIELNKDQQDNPFNARLIAEGRLISLSKPKAAQEQAEDKLPDDQKEGDSQ